MKAVYRKDQRLESHRLFPFVGWTLIILLSVFVFNITMELKNTTNRLQAKVESLEKKIGVPPEKIADFEN